MSKCQFFAALDGAVIPGGCAWCNAEQHIAPAEIGWKITIKHDDWCPWWIERSAARR